jgi:hypothetical protein
MSLTLGSSSFLLAVALLAAAAFAWWSYSRTTPALTTGRRALFGGLRFASLAIIIFLLFDPSILRSESEEHEPTLIFLIDNSASVPFVEGDEGEERLRNALADLPPAAREMPILAFEAGLTALDNVGETTESLTFEGARTNIAAAIEGTRTHPARAIRGAVLISDGLYNTGRNPIFAAEDAAVPVHTVVVGDTTAYEDIILREIETNRVAYSGAELPIRARIVAEGFAGRTVGVTVSEGASVLRTESLTLRGDGTEQSIDLYVIPREPGLRRFTVRVSELEGEATHRNNVRSTTVRVVDTRRQVLLIGGAPDPDIGAIRQSIVRDEEIELTTWIQRSPDAFYQGALPSDLSDYDLVILSGFPSPGTSGNLINDVASRLRQARVPTLYLAGRAINVAGVNALGDEIAIGLPGPGSGRREVVAEMTSPGRSHPVSATAASDAAVWGRFPALVAHDGTWQASADASILLATTARSGGQPLVVVRSREGVRRASILAADTWKWRTVSPTIAGAEGVFDRLIENMLQWLTSPEDTRLVRATPTQDVFEGGETVRLLGEVYDERLTPVEDADMEVEITPETGEAFRLPMRQEGRGRYRLDAGQLPEGVYSYRATASRNGVNIGMDSGTFTVGALEREFISSRADAAIMRQIAARSGGISTDLAGMSSLVEELLASPSFTPEREHIVREASLRHTVLLLLLVVLLLAAEWILRKRSGMV